MGCNVRVVGGRIASVDVTVVGSGPNGLAAAVICARAGLSVQVFEAQPTLGGGARTLADPEFSGVAHDICSAVHPLALASPFLAEFDLPGRGVTLKVPEIAYANPLPDQPAAVGYHDLDRTCAELDDGDSWRRLLGPLVGRDDGVIKLLLGDKRSISPDPIAAIRVARRLLEQGTPAWRALSGDDARALFTGVAAHTISPDAVAGVRRRGADAGHAGAHRRLADTGRRQPGHPERIDRRPARTRRHRVVGRGDHRTSQRCGAFRYSSHRAAEYLPRPIARAVRKGAAALSFRSGCGEGRLRAVGRDSVE